MFRILTKVVLMSVVCVHGTGAEDQEAAEIKLTEKDQKYYVHKFGAHFAAGFLKGAKVGNFKSQDIFDCL